jgi:hypothetical protein
MNETSTGKKPAEKKAKTPRKLNGRRQPIKLPQEILPNAFYDREQAAVVIGCSVITLLRAYYAGYLKACRTGRHLRHSGQQLLDWIADGGKTGHARKAA